MHVAHWIYTISAANGLAIASLLGLLMAASAIYERKRRRNAESASVTIQAQLNALVAERTADLESSNRTLALQLREGEKAMAQISRQIEALSSVFDGIPLAIFVCDGNGKLTFSNRAACDLIGLVNGATPPKGWADALNLYSLHSNSRITPDQFPLFRALNGEVIRNAEFLVIPRSGAQQRDFLVNAQLLNLGQHSCGAILTMYDVTEKMGLHRKSLRAQRLENIGVLAGGLAHDLNNVLAPIVMGVELLRSKATNGSSEILSTIQNSAGRATDLVKQILIFGRGLDGNKLLISPAQVLYEMKRIIQGTFPKGICLILDIPQGLWNIEANPTGFHQALLSLCVNAREAMDGNGTLTLAARNVTLSNHSDPDGRTHTGEYLLFTVKDTGTGISTGLRHKIFDPFFTTKPLGQRTGLGLSTVMAAVKEHKGFIEIESRPQEGAAFLIYLPALPSSPTETLTRSNSLRIPHGNGETILLIEDEITILTLGKEALGAAGYNVLTAKNGAEGIAIYSLKRASIALVVTDLNMPVMDGDALTGALRTINPGVRILGTSGNDSAPGFEETVNAYLHKPYSTHDLLLQINSLLRPQAARDQIHVTTPPSTLPLGGSSHNVPSPPNTGQMESLSRRG
jgi:signal transduction histidine kinase/DNA-binding NarL/FixJ family response regulator